MATFGDVHPLSIHSPSSCFPSNLLCFPLLPAPAALSLLCLNPLWPRQEELFPSVNTDGAELIPLAPFLLLPGCKLFIHKVERQLYSFSSYLWNILTFPHVCFDSVPSLNKYLPFSWEEFQELLPGMHLSS